MGATHRVFDTFADNGDFRHHDISNGGRTATRTSDASYMFWRTVAIGEWIESGSAEATVHIDSAHDNGGANIALGVLYQECEGRVNDMSLSSGPHWSVSYQHGKGIRKGTNVVSTNGVTANCVCISLMEELFGNSH